MNVTIGTNITTAEIIVPMRAYVGESVHSIPPRIAIIIAGAHAAMPSITHVIHVAGSSHRKHTMADIIGVNVPMIPYMISPAPITLRSWAMYTAATTVSASDNELIITRTANDIRVLNFM